MVGRQVDKVILSPSKRRSKCGKVDKKKCRTQRQYSPASGVLLFGLRLGSLGYIQKGNLFPGFCPCFQFLHRRSVVHHAVDRVVILLGGHLRRFDVAFRLGRDAVVGSKFRYAAKKIKGIRLYLLNFSMQTQRGLPL